MAHFMTLPEALDKLDLAAVWDMAPNQNGVACPQPGSVIKSPLRVDHKGASFSVDRTGKLFKDHVDDTQKGGVWAFVALCKPEWGKREIARELITRAGGDPDMKDPTWKPISRAERERKRVEMGERVRRDFVNKQRSINEVPADKLLKAPARIIKGWEKAGALAAAPEWIARLSAERGWPEEWSIALVQMGKMACSSKREPAFAVEVYPFGGYARFIGLHTRWINDAGGKAWAYRPCAKWDKQEVAAAPFVLGRLESPLWILTEGQWDAATAYGLLGGFDGTMLLECAVFGIRGVSGIDVFMHLYAEHIRRLRPLILLVPDCDKAAAGWTADTPKAWSFQRRMKAIFPALDGRLAALKLKPREGCKDLNDFYKNAGLTGDQLAAMAATIMETNKRGNV